MLPVVRTSAMGRLGAVLVAVALTGAPALAARPEHAREHRCQCKAGAHHECECPRCREAARRAREAAVEQVPPCHRAAAALAAASAAPPAARQEPPGPCMTGSCGGPEAPWAALTGIERFTLPLAQAPPGAAPPSGEVEPAFGSEREVPHAPEAPPPRAA